MKTPSLAVGALVLALAGCGGSCAIPTAPGFHTVAIRVLRQHGQVMALVPVTIDGKGPFTFALDTGATQSLLDKQVAIELGVARAGPTEPLAGVSSIGQGVSIVVRSWSVGDVRLPATRVIEANLPFGNASGGVQGLLGSDMLSRFDIITIDYGRQVLRLHEHSSR